MKKMVSCSCIKGEFNFVLDYSNCSEIIFKDASLWMQGGDFVIPETYQVTVTSPVAGIRELTLTVKAPNLLSPGELGLPSECFPDGYYTFSTTTCGDTFSKTIAITCSLRCCLADLITRSNINDLPIIQEVQFYIFAAELNAGYGNEEEFTKFFSLAKDSLKAYNCKCGCS